MSMNVVTLLYLIASVCFIQALKGLSNPKTARIGNTFGMAGMAIAILTTIALIVKQANALGSNLGLGLGLLLVALVIGGAIGALVAARVEMTKMPELVAAMHSLIGLAAVCIAYAVVSEPSAFGLVDPENGIPGFLPYGNRVELFIGTFVGAITFSGSVIAFGKLSGKYKFRLFQGAPVVYGGQHLINLLLALAMLGFGILFFLTQSWLPFIIMTLIAFVLGVLIVPGYGLAVARAQHALKELTDKLVEKGIEVKYAIHPVAGRMPGHMNVLLAEAEVPYDMVYEMDDINGEFGQVDVVLVLGANDVVNPAAKNDPKSPIAGMPIIEAYKARTVIVNKRSMAAGYAGLDNDLFYMDKTMMVFGDAKKVIEDMVKAVE